MNTFKFFKRMLSIAFIITLVTFMACHNKEHEQPAVSISGFAPAEGKAGDAVTISGNNFSATASSNVVDFNGTNATVTSATTTSLVVTIPPGATSGKISVAFEKSKGASTDNFTVLMPATITSFSPASGPVGTVVTITGTNFSTAPADNAVKFNGTAAVVSAATAIQLMVTVPANSVTGKISITVNGITITSTGDFAVTPPLAQAPTITSFSPIGGSPGTTVTITGSNFDATAINNVVKFNGTGAVVTNATASSLTVTVPQGATTGAISVMINGVTVSSATDFTVVASGLRWRVKEVHTNGFKTTEYVYDNNNVLTQAKNYNQDQSDPNSVAKEYSATDFLYNADGTLSSSKKGVLPNNPNNAYYVTDYQYSGGVVLSYTYSYLVGNVKTLQFTSSYTYENGVLITSTFDDVQTGSSQVSYTYATDNSGNPQTIVHYPGFNSTYTFYLNVLSPDPLDILLPDNTKLVTKTYISGANANYNENVTYTIDADGNIDTVQHNLPGMPSLNYTNTYIFETY